MAERERQRSAATVFESTAGQFAAALDGQIRRDKFVRGKLFAQEVSSKVRPGGRILDYGCGPGRLAHHLARAGYDVTGVDPAPSMIEESRRLTDFLPNLRFEVDNGNLDCLAAKAFDAIVCSSVVEYISDYESILNLLHGLLIPNGWLILSFANRVSLWRKYHDYRCASTSPQCAVRHNLWSWAECRTIIEKAGFRAARRPTYYESILDPIPLGTALSRLKLIGALGVFSARKTAMPDDARGGDRNRA